MVFSSFQFIFVFLPIGLFGYYRLAALPQGRKLWLIAISLVFYSWGAVRDLPILLVSLGVNHLVAARMKGAPRADRGWLVAGLIFNVLLLGLFKYTTFALSSIAALTAIPMAIPTIALPLGVSFFTLQQVMFLVDRYEGLVARQSLVDYAQFVSFFPYVTSGPIVHWKESRPAPALEINYDQLARGLFIFLLGLVKKVVVADTMVRWVNLGFGSAAPLGFGDAWVTALAFTFQLYYDFSGYSDMAVGLGLMFGFELPNNFASPYRACSIVDFWKRWHISLSRFITTYLYTPLLRMTRTITFGKAMGATMVAMTIAGLWHGPSWNYVVFGMLHGLALVANNVSRRLKLKFPRFLGWGVTFLFVVVAFVVFRAGTLGHAGQLLAAMVRPSTAGALPAFAEVGPLDSLLGVMVAIPAVAGCFFFRNTGEFLQEFQPSRKWLILSVAAFFAALLFLNSTAAKGFIYVDF